MVGSLAVDEGEVLHLAEFLDVVFVVLEEDGAFSCPDHGFDADVGCDACFAANVADDIYDAHDGLHHLFAFRIDL